MMEPENQEPMATILTFTRAASPRGPDACLHYRVGVDPSKRHVWCLDCEADLDPVAVIAMYADQHRSAADTLKTATEETWEAMDRFRQDGGTLSITLTRGVLGSLKINGNKVQRSGYAPGSTSTQVAHVIRVLRQVESFSRKEPR